MMNKQKPIIKFNGARGAILCNTCYTIIKQDLTREEFQGNTNLLFCNECKSKQYEQNKTKETKG